MRRPGGMALLLIVMATAPMLATAQQGGFYEQGGVEYYMAVGEIGSGHLSQGLDHNRTAAMPFEGCAIAKLRPDMELGRILVYSTVDDTPFEVEFVGFGAERPDMQGGIATDMKVDGSHTHGSIQHPAVTATVAAWGETALIVSGGAYPDPATGSPYLAGTFFVTPNGFRDDVTGRIYDVQGGPYEPGDPAIRGVDDYEMHIRIESAGSGVAPANVQTIQRPPRSTGFETFPPNTEYREVFAFPNRRFGGTATLDIDLNAFAPDGMNRLEALVRGPTGIVLDQLVVDAALFQAGGTAQTTFPLDRFGTYYVEVTGDLSLSQYSMTFSQAAGGPLDLNLWWDNVTFGVDAPAAQDRCFEAIEGSSAPVSGTISPRPLPNPWPWTSVVFTTMAGVATLVVAVKMTMLARAAIAHRRLAKG